MVCILKKTLKDITLSELRRNLYEVRDAVQYKGEAYRVLYYSHPVAYCIPVDQVQADWRIEEVAIANFRQSMKGCCERLRRDELDGFTLSVFGQLAMAFVSEKKGRTYETKSSMD